MKTRVMLPLIVCAMALAWVGSASALSISPMSRTVSPLSSFGGANVIG